MAETAPLSDKDFNDQIRLPGLYSKIILLPIPVSASRERDTDPSFSRFSAKDAKLAILSGKVNKQTPLFMFLFSYIVIVSACSKPNAWGVLPKILGGGVPYGSQNPDPISDQNI